MSRTDLGSDGEGRNWLDWELAGHGTPPGFYILCFLGFLAIMLAGLDSRHAMAGWAGLLLSLAWALANLRYPVDEQADQ